MTLALDRRPGRYGEPSSARNAPMTGESITALHCLAAAEIWAASGNPVHEAFAPTLDQWAANATARAAAPIEEQPDLFAGDM